MFLFVVIFIVCVFGGFSGRFETCKLEPLKSSPFCNVALSHDERIDYILSKMDFQDKSYLMDTSTWEKSLLTVKLSPFNFQQEGLHGLASCNFTNYKVTSFPQVANLGATFDMSLIQEMASAISDEGRALSNVLAIDPSYFAPNLNIFRDPRWGRGQETPGEDPFLTSSYAKAYITGIQFGDDPKYLKGISGTKHYTAYDLENWNGMDRYHFNAIVSKRDMEETFQPPFKAAVTEAGVRQIMCSYNEINSVPSCASEYYMTEVLRNQWGFEGHVVSDCGAIAFNIWRHQYFKTPEDSVSVSVKSGCDLDCGWLYDQWLWYAYDIGLLSDTDLNLAARRMLKNRMLLGEFDPWESQQYRKIPTSVISSKKHQDLALQLAQESIVLLKNEESRVGSRLVLPLNISTFQQIALIGPHFDSTEALQGDYYGPPPYIISPEQGVKTYFHNVKTSRGCSIDNNNTEGFQSAIELARESSLTILFMGLDQSQECEMKDRSKLTFPGVQEELIQKIALDPQRKGDLVLVLINGGPIDISWEKTSSEVQSILWAGYPSQEGGQAIADVLFGKVNPAGRLVTTIYPKEYINQVSMENMDMRQSPGRTYKFYNGEVVYPFGYGMSYTDFDYSWGDEEEEIMFMNEEKKNMTLKVKNIGDRSGDHVILAFITNTFMSDAPKKKLFWFTREKKMNSGETREVVIEISQFALEYVNKEGQRVVLKGKYIVQVGNIQKVVVFQ